MRVRLNGVGGWVVGREGPWGPGAVNVINIPQHSGRKSCLRKHLPRGLNGFSVAHAVVSS